MDWEGMTELYEIAEAHYEAAPPEMQELAHDFFDTMDRNRDGHVDRREFLSFMRQEGYPQMENRYFFDILDRDGSGTLDFFEVMTLYYIVKSGRPFCDQCGHFITGIFFACVACYNRRGREFHLCRDCYCSSTCMHNHNGRSQFLDNYTLLEIMRDSTHQQRLSPQTRSPVVQSNATVPSTATNPNIIYYGYYNQTYNVMNSSPSSSLSHARAVVPHERQRGRWSNALRAFELALSIGNIVSTGCTIL